MELGMPVSQPKWYHRKRLLVAGLLASVLGVSVVAYVQSSQPRSVQFVMRHVDDFPNGAAIKAELRKAHARFEARRQGNFTVAPLELKASQFNVHCYQWTGGTCRFQNCDKSRHATCQHDWGQGYSCVCPSGMCTGSDGSCYAGTYEKIADGVEIKNVKWPSETLYFPTFAMAMKMGASSNADSKGYDRKFDFYKLQGHLKGQVEVYVTTTNQPDWIVWEGSESDHFTGTVQMYKLGRGWADPQMASTILCKVKNGGTGYQLASYGGFLSKSINYWYISKLSVLGYVNLWQFSKDPGTQGHWTFDPPIDDSSLNTCA